MKPTKKKRVKEEEFPDTYCKDCGGCGYIGCCGIRSFLKHHVEGKTNCPNEHDFIHEIIDFVENHPDFQLNFPEGDKVQLANNYERIFYARNEKGEMAETHRTNIGTLPPLSTKRGKK